MIKKLIRAAAALPLRLWDFPAAAREAARTSRREAERLAPDARTPSCPNCGGPAAFEVRAGDYNDAISDETFSYFRCARCGTLALDPVPADLGRYYKNDYPAYDASFLAQGMARARYRVEMLLPYKKSGAVLDIGAGIGTFVRLAHEAGFRPTVIEADEGCCRALRDQLKIDAFCSVKPHEVALPKERFDVITLWHSIEHLPQALETLKTAVSWLKPDGILLIATPNVECLQYRLFGRWWHHLDAPRHVVFFPVDALTAALAELGLRRESLTCADRGGILCNYSSWMLSLSNRAQGPRRKAALALAGRVLFVLALPLEVLGRRGTAYTGIWRKSPGA